MKKLDAALTCPNPHLIAAIYFGLLSVVGTILTNALLSLAGITEIIPLFAAVLLGMVVSSITGALFGERIIHSPKPYKLKTFLTGFFMVLGSLPFYDLGFMLFMQQENSSLLPLMQEMHWFNFYLMILAYSYLLFGIVLAVGSGLAALYLRGQLVYDILGTYGISELKKIPTSPVARNRIEHSDSVRIRHK